MSYPQSKLIIAENCSESQVSSTDVLVTGIIGEGELMKVFMNTEIKCKDDQILSLKETVESQSKQISDLQKGMEDLQNKMEGLRNDIEKPKSSDYLSSLAKQIGQLIKSNYGPGTPPQRPDASLKRGRGSQKRWSYMSENSVDKEFSRNQSYSNGLSRNRSQSDASSGYGGSINETSIHSTHQANTGQGDNNTSGEQVKHQDSIGSDVDPTNCCLDNASNSGTTSTPMRPLQCPELHDIDELTEMSSKTNIESLVLEALLAMEEVVTVLCNNTDSAQLIPAAT